LTRSKKLLQVEVHDVPITLGNVLLRLGHRLLSRATRPKTVAVLGKRRVPNALQNLQHRLLDKTVDHGRDAKLSHPAVSFRNLNTFDRLRLVSAAPQLFPNGSPMLTQVVRHFVGRQTVDTRTAFVTPNPIQRIQDVL